MYVDLPNYQSNSYTSAHTGEEDYRVGSVISMPREEGDDDKVVDKVVGDVDAIRCTSKFEAAVAPLPRKITASSVILALTESRIILLDSSKKLWHE